MQKMQKESGILALAKKHPVLAGLLGGVALIALVYFGHIKPQGQFITNQETTVRTSFTPKEQAEKIKAENPGLSGLALYNAAKATYEKLLEEGRCDEALDYLSGLIQTVPGIAAVLLSGNLDEWHDEYVRNCGDRTGLMWLYFALIYDFAEGKLSSDFKANHAEILLAKLTDMLKYQVQDDPFSLESFGDALDRLLRLLADAGVHPNAIYALTAEWMRCYAVCIQQGNFADKDWAKEYVEANYYACEKIRDQKDGDFQPVEKANERVTRSLTGIGR